MLGGPLSGQGVCTEGCSLALAPLPNGPKLSWDHCSCACAGGRLGAGACSPQRPGACAAYRAGRALGFCWAKLRACGSQEA